MWRGRHRDPAAWPAAGRKGFGVVEGVAEASRRPTTPVFSPRPPLSLGREQRGPRTPASAPASACSSAARAWTFPTVYLMEGRVGELVGRFPNSLCPHPRACRGPPRRFAPSPLSAHPLLALEGSGSALLSTPTKGEMRGGSGRVGGRRSFTRLALPEKSDRNPLCTLGPGSKWACASRIANVWTE